MAHAGTMDLGRNAQAKPSGNPWRLIGLAVAAVAIIAAVWFASSAGLVGGSLSAKPAAGGRSDEQIEAQRSLTLAAGGSYQAVNSQRNPLEFSADRHYDASAAAIAATGVCPEISASTGFSVNVACPALSVSSGVLSGKSADDIVLGRDFSYNIEAQRGLIATGLPVCRGFSPTSGLAYSYACSTAVSVPQTASTYSWSPAQYEVARTVYIAPARPLMVQPALDAKAARILALAKAEAQASGLNPLLSSTSGTFHAGNPAVGEQITLLRGWKTIDLPPKRDRVGGP